MHSISHTFTYVWQYSKIETIKKHGCQAQTPLKKDVNHHLRFVLWFLALYKFVYVMYMHTAVKAGLSERMKKHVLMPLSWKDWERFCKFRGQKRKQSWSKEGTVGYCRSKEASILWSHYEETRELSGERDVARNNAMCMQARKTNAMYSSHLIFYLQHGWNYSAHMPIAFSLYATDTEDTLKSGAFSYSSLQSVGWKLMSWDWIFKKTKYPICEITVWSYQHRKVHTRHSE